MYKVIRNFKDKDGRFYNEGDPYPIEGVKKPTAARIKMLSSAGNSYNQMFIQKIQAPKEK